MAKNDTGPAKKPAAKKSAAPYTPEVVPDLVSKPPGAPTIIAAPPAVAAPSKVEPAPITWELISERAYFISISGTGGDQDHNWHRAEAELKRESDA